MKLEYPSAFERIIQGNIPAPNFGFVHKVDESEVRLLHPMCSCWDFLSKMVHINLAEQDYTCGYRNSANYYPTYSGKKSIFEKDKLRFAINTRPPKLGSLDRLERNLKYLNELEGIIGFSPTLFHEVKGNPNPYDDLGNWGVIEADLGWTHNALNFHTYKILTRIVLQRDADSYANFIMWVAGYEHFYGHTKGKVQEFLEKTIPTLTKHEFKTWNGFPKDYWTSYYHQCGPATLLALNYMKTPYDDGFQSSIVKVCWKIYNNK